MSENSNTKNLTEGDPGKLILNFALPLIAGNIIQQLYGFIDTLLVGRFLGVEALAAVGCTGPIMFLMITLNVGFTSGITILTGQRFGAGDKNGVRRSAATCIKLATVYGVILALIGGIFCQDILMLLNTPPELLDRAESFISVFCWGLPIASFYLLGCNIIRALGNSKTPTIIMSVSLLINIVLEPIFMLTLGWGIPGAAWAIIASQLIAGIYCVIYIEKNIPELHPRANDWRFGWKFSYAHLRLAVPVAFQFSLISLGVFIVQYALNNIGSEAVAAYAAASRVDSVAVMPMMSFGIAMGAYTAQNFGAQNFDRIREGLRKCAMMSSSFSVVIGVILIMSSGFFMEIFVGEEMQVIEYGKTYLLITGCTYWILSFLFVYRFTLVGVGMSAVPVFAGIMELAMRAIAAIYFADIWGYMGVCLSNPMAWAGSCIPLVITYYLTVYRKKNPPIDLWSPTSRA